MAKFLISFQCAFLMQLGFVIFADSLENSLCSYPKGSIVCKTWNHTSVDCSWRELDCIPVIHQDPLELLDLSNNKLTVLPSGVFNTFNKLGTFNVSFNNISVINDHAFSGLVQLTFLNISHNSLESLALDVFNGLESLKTLDLSWNKLSLPDNAFKGLNNLLNLFLNSNFLYFSIRNNSFAGLQKLHILDLSWSSLNKISGSPFHHLKALHTLKLDESYITVTPTFFDGINHSLHELSVCIWNMTKDSPFLQLSSLQHLELTIWNCDHVNDQLFNGLRKLKHLKLVLEEDLFQTCEHIDLSPLLSLKNFSYYNGGWENLTSFHTYLQPLNSLMSSPSTLEIKFPISFSVELNSATFESLPKWKERVTQLHIHCDYVNEVQLMGSPFKWFSKLCFLSIQGFYADSINWDSARQIFKGLINLTELHLNHLDIHDDIFADMVEMFVVDRYPIKVLDLSHNRIQSLPYNISRLSLKVLDLSNNNNAKFPDFGIFHIADNCGSTRLLNLQSGLMAFIKNGVCSYLTTLKISNNKIFVYSFNEILHLPLLQELYISQITIDVSREEIALAKIKLLQYIDSPNLKILDLSSNQITTIDQEDALKLSSVTQLDLSNNQLKSISFLNYLHAIQVLFLSTNQITSVSMSCLLEKPLKIIDLHDNVLVCDCTIENFQKWILTDKIVYLTHYLSETSVNNYQCIEPQSKKGFGVTNVDLDCDVPLLMYITVSCASVLTVIIIFILVIRYRWHLRYKWFLLLNRRRYHNLLVDNDDPEDEFEDEDGLPRYDAYVIYHNLDEDWVDEQLLANIEEDHEEPFKLCLKNRDIRVGRLIFNELSLHIRRSRKILVILTPRFVNDNWCYFQLNMAHHRVLEENHNVLILITLEEIPINRLTLLLRQLFCKSKCLKWPDDRYGQNLFWQCLRQELKRPVPRDDQVNRYRQYHI